MPTLGGWDRDLKSCRQTLQSRVSNAQHLCKVVRALSMVFVIQVKIRPMTSASIGSCRLHSRYSTYYISNSAARVNLGWCNDARHVSALAEELAWLKPKPPICMYHRAAVHQNRSFSYQGKGERSFFIMYSIVGNPRILPSVHVIPMNV